MHSSVVNETFPAAAERYCRPKLYLGCCVRDTLLQMFAGAVTYSYFYCAHASQASYGQLVSVQRKAEERERERERLLATAFSEEHDTI